MARKAGKTDKDAPDTITIKKYANRRLYNTATSSYVTLDHLCQMVKDGIDFVVVDAKSGEDITRSVLTQIIVEEEGKGDNLLPISFLPQLIAMYGNSMQAMMPPYLEAAMANFQTNQSALQEAFQSNMGADALSKMAESNMAMFNAAASAFMPGAATAPAPTAAPAEDTDDIDTLRKQMAEMQRKLDKLGK